MKYYVIEYYKGQPCGCDKIADSKAEAEEWIAFQFEHNPGIDYKTTFSIEERDN
jgi:hypothetical protein